MPITNQCFMEMVNDMEQQLNGTKEKEGDRYPVYQRQRPEETYRDSFDWCIKKYSLYFIKFATFQLSFEYNFLLFYNKIV